MTTTELDQKREEFFRFVWDHSKDPFLLAFEQRRHLSDEEVNWLIRAFEACFVENETEAIESIKKLIDSEGQQATILLIQIAGLTRNKIITDLKAHLGRQHSPRSHRTLHKSEEGIKYLLQRLRLVFSPLRQQGIGDNQQILRCVFESLNQATYPGFIRQERAKRQGHEAERRLALLLHSIGIPFVPVEKLDNPLSRDIQLFGVSFDIAVPNGESPKVLVKSTVQTANIGQFGESKSALEVEEAKGKLEQVFPNAPPPYLVALVDGIGFESNREGLDSVLLCAHEFVQFRTLWKFAVIVSSVLGKSIKIEQHPELGYFEYFLKRYDNTIKICEELPDGVEAGFTRVKVE